MARPSKYTPELVKRITKYIADGLNICDACYGVGISADTFCRWRKEKPEFNEAINRATAAQVWSSVTLAQTSRYRRYARRQKYNTKLSPNKAEGAGNHFEQNKTILGHFEASEGHITMPYDNLTGLPIKSGVSLDKNGELIPCNPYVNSETNRVEWVDKFTSTNSLVRHVCSREIWAKKKQKLNT